MTFILFFLSFLLAFCTHTRTRADKRTRNTGDNTAERETLVGNFCERCFCLVVGRGCNRADRSSISQREKLCGRLEPADCVQQTLTVTHTAVEKAAFTATAGSTQVTDLHYYGLKSVIWTYRKLQANRHQTKAPIKYYGIHLQSKDIE